ncbi:leucine-rich repeat domain-containing protein [Formosa algae]|uniref:Leucine-rich repeat (LRR) protein n=1 Tax=Formosa algae TaxID=225843 RepID=A0A9X0YL24_9FLAO|nr:hypothetical protein [Formosa algae]MBP1840566.1 Leucine-rich repeat (LRR) protein [Formosa algae]MDQ0336021.1 Leucine-rich repeat (LRR) protein [Formosa algae]OEI81092.1 hypothetical protein AST99_05370 [Formosa algae]
MEFNINDLTSYYTHLKTQPNYPKTYLYELFAVGKTSRDEIIVNEVSKILETHGTPELLSAFNTLNKLPEDGQNSTEVLKALLKYGLKDPLFPIGKLYTMFGFSSLSIRTETIAETLEKQPDLISRLNGITKLKIANVFTNGLPEEICDITSLTALDIEGDYQALPVSIGHLKQLEDVSLELPKLIVFPESFWSLNNIKELELSDIETDIQASLQLEKLTKLEELGFYEVNLKDSSQLKLPSSLKELDFIRLEHLTKLPTSISSLVNLEKFNLFKCPLLVEIPNVFHNLNKLFVLKFKAVPLIKTLEDHQIFTANCEYITLDDNIEIIPAVSPISNSELLIRDVKILNYVLSHPERFVNLKKLKIHYITIFADVTTGLGQLTTLESIDIHQGSHTETLFQNIENCTHLRYLKLYGVTIISIPEGLKDLEHLEYLSFNSCRELVLEAKNLPSEIKDLHLFDIKAYVPAEKSLETEQAYFGNLAIEAPQVLFQNLITTSLHFSGINECENTQEDLTQYLPKPEVLTTLKAYTNTGHFQNVLVYCTNLEHLHLDNNEASQATLTSLPAPKLKYFKLDFYKEDNLESIIKNMPNLEGLNMAHYDVSTSFPKVTLPNLKALDLSYTTFESLETLEAPVLESIYIALSYQFGMAGYAKLNQFKALKKLSFMGISDEVNSIPESISELKLTEFLINHKFEVLPEFIQHMTTLKTLSLGGNDFVDLPTWIADLPHLERLDIDNCKFENAVPEYFQKLKLKELKYYISGFDGYNMNPEKYKNLITPGYTELKKEFSKESNV